MSLSSSSETPCSVVSPQLKESMDLYEEIITEEQRGIESAQTEVRPWECSFIRALKNALTDTDLALIIKYWCWHPNFSWKEDSLRHKIKLRSCERDCCRWKHRYITTHWPCVLISCQMKCFVFITIKQICYIYLTFI